MPFKLVLSLTEVTSNGNSPLLRFLSPFFLHPSTNIFSPFGKVPGKKGLPFLSADTFDRGQVCKYNETEGKRKGDSSLSR